MLVCAAFAALTCLAADVAVWDGLSMSAWTNTMARWRNPRVTADGLAVEAEVQPSLGLAKADYVPEPKPVKTGKYEIGAFLFPFRDGTRTFGMECGRARRTASLFWAGTTRRIPR